MPKRTRLQDVVRSVWKRSHEEYESWPLERRDATAPAVEALLEWLRECSAEAELDVKYWISGDPPGCVLRKHLPDCFDLEDQLTIEEACFWRRLIEISGEVHCSTSPA